MSATQCFHFFASGGSTIYFYNTLLSTVQSFFILSSLREWNVERLLGTAQKVLTHPSFVYCAQYHPTAQNLVVTGGYDSVLRVWRLDVNDLNGQLLQEFEGHNSFINTVCFDSEGMMFTILCRNGHKLCCCCPHAQCRVR